MSGEYLKMKTKDGTPYVVLNLVDFTFVIESETLGLFRGFDRAAQSNKWGPRWLRADRHTRRSPEVWSTNHGPDAVEMIERVMAHAPTAYVVRMTRK